MKVKLDLIESQQQCKELELWSVKALEGPRRLVNTRWREQVTTPNVWRVGEIAEEKIWRIFECRQEKVWRNGKRKGNKYSMNSIHYSITSICTFMLQLWIHRPYIVAPGRYRDHCPSENCSRDNCPKPIARALTTRTDDYTRWRLHVNRLHSLLLHASDMWVSVPWCAKQFN